MEFHLVCRLKRKLQLMLNIKSRNDIRRVCAGLEVKRGLRQLRLGRIRQTVLSQGSDKGHDEASSIKLPILQQITSHKVVFDRYYKSPN